MTYLLDTNVISESIRKKPNDHVKHFLQATPPHLLFLSVFSVAEIRKGIEQLHNTDAKKQHLTKWLENDLNSFFNGRMLAFDHIVADKWGFMVGKIKNPVATMDSLIAAISFAHNLKLVTRNVKDFELYPIEVFNPWDNYLA